MAAIEHIHGGNLREAEEKFGLKKEDIIDFSANINPLGPANSAIKAITSNLESIIHYPDPGAVVLRNAVSKHFGLPSDMIVTGNGAIEILYLLMKVLRPQKALIPAPTFNEYEIAVKVNGGEVKDLPLDEKNGFNLDIDHIFSQWDDTQVVFICNPNNPTGCLTGRHSIIEVIDKAAETGKCVVVDEAFMDFVEGKENWSVVDMVARYPNLFVLYSLTKFYAIPGLRLGIGFGSPHLVKKIDEIRDPWNVNCFAQLAGVASLMDKEYISSTMEYMSAEKDYLYSRIKEVPGLRPLKPSVNYILINVEDTGRNSAEVTHKLGRMGILVRDCSSYKNLRPVYIRAAVKKRDDNERLVLALMQLGRE